MPLTKKHNKSLKQVMKKIGVLTFLLFIVGASFSQTIIKMKRQGGVSIIPCQVNGLDLELIFDTGASDVSISLTEAAAMLHNGKLTKSDIIGTSNYQDANGDITEGIVINIKEIQIAGLKMTNIKASVVKNLDAPLLLGQTAISKLGKIQLDLNNNTLTILNGKGTYDYSTYSLTEKIEKHYKDFSVLKIKKNDNKEGLSFSYTIPKKWIEEKVTNPLKFKKYVGEEYPYGCVVGLDIGLQTLPSLYNNYDSCQSFVESINTLMSNVDPSFKLVSTEQTKIYFCKTIKNIILTKDEDVNRLSCQYWIFCGNKCISFVYTLYSSDQNKIISLSSDFDDFCTSQASNIIIFNALENAATCTIQSNAIENKKDISIILNNACKWFKSEGNSELNLVNNSTFSTLSIQISDKNNDFSDFDEVSTADLIEVKNSIIRGIGSSDQILTSQIITLNKKKYVYFSAKSKNNNDYILTECYYYAINNRLIMILSLVKDENEENLKIRFKKTQNDLKDLLNVIEIISNKPKNANDYFNKGLTKAQANDYKGAVVDFNISIELNPKFTEAYYNRGNAKSRLQDYKGAIDDFNKAILINPTFTQAYYNRGVVKIQLQDYKGALTDFNKTIDLQSDFADAYLNRGLMKIVLETKESGCIDLNKASELGSTKAEKAIKTYCQ